MSDMQPITSEKEQQEAAAEAVRAKDPSADDVKKNGARRVFHLTNFLGLHMLFNSTVSVLIAYNLLPTKFAQKKIDWLAKSPMGQIADRVLSLPSKGVDSILKLFNGKKAARVLTEAEKVLESQHNARSSIETAFMCIAGFIALWPVKYLEDHRVGFINTVDNWLHPGRSKAEKEAVALKQGDEPRETWWNLLRARFIGLGAVFMVDRLQQHFNNWRTYEKGNVDTAAWKFGAKAYDKMNTKVRTWLVEFFARKNVNLKGLQPMIRTHLLRVIESPPELMAHNEEINALQTQIKHTLDKSVQETLGKQIDHLKDAFTKQHPHLTSSVERAVFAEQSRLLLTKELWLTAIMSTIIYTCAKAPFMARAFEKIGLQKKGTFDARHRPKNGSGTQDAMTPEPQAAEAPVATEKRWAERTGSKKSAVETLTPASSHQEAVMQSSQNPEASLAV